MRRFAVIEDKPARQRDLTNWIKAFDMNAEVDNWFTLEDARRALTDKNYDLVCLDIELGTDRYAGFSLLGLIAALDVSQRPAVIVISGIDPSNAHEHKLISKKLGAFEYLPTATLTEREFVTTAEFVLQRHPKERYVLTGWENFDIQLNGKMIILTGSQMRILKCLWDKRVEQDPLANINELGALLSYNSQDSNLVSAHISALRTKLKQQEKDFDCIVTEPLRGYRWQIKTLPRS